MAVFYLLIITEIVPNKIVLGGKIIHLNEKLKVESVSISLNLIVPFRVAVNDEWFQLRIPFIEKTSFCLMFIFANTMENLLSINDFDFLSAQ